MKCWAAPTGGERSSGEEGEFSAETLITRKMKFTCKAAGKMENVDG